jgi:hypothetical protein
LRRASRKKEKEKIMSNDPNGEFPKKTEHPWVMRDNGNVIKNDDVPGGFVTILELKSALRDVLAAYDVSQAALYPHTTAATGRVYDPPVVAVARKLVAP